MGTGASLLLTLLEALENKPSQISQYIPPPDPKTPKAVVSTTSKDVNTNVSTVVKNIKPLPKGKPNVLKNVAQKELYETLYSIIQKEYNEPPTALSLPGHPRQEEQLTQQQRLDAELNRTLNSAIGMALESAIRAVSEREAKKEKPLPGDDSIITLREALRKKIIETLTPK